MNIHSSTDRMCKQESHPAAEAQHASQLLMEELKLQIQNVKTVNTAGFSKDAFAVLSEVVERVKSALNERSSGRNAVAISVTNMANSKLKSFEYKTKFLFHKTFDSGFVLASILTVLGIRSVPTNCSLQKNYEVDELEELLKKERICKIQKVTSVTSTAEIHAYLQAVAAKAMKTLGIRKRNTISDESFELYLLCNVNMCHCISIDMYANVIYDSGKEVPYAFHVDVLTFLGFGQDYGRQIGLKRISPSDAIKRFKKDESRKIIIPKPGMC